MVFLVVVVVVVVGEVGVVVLFGEGVFLFLVCQDILRLV